NAWDCRDLLDVLQGELVFHLHRQNQLAVWIHRPWISLLHVLVCADTPDAGRCRLAARSAKAFRYSAICASEFRAVERIARRLNERSRGIGIPRVTQHQSLDARNENLLNHPRVRADRRTVETEERQRDDDGRDVMAAFGGTAIGQPLHELLEALGIER